MNVSSQLTRALLEGGGGGGAFERSLRLIEDSENTAAGSAARFSLT